MSDTVFNFKTNGTSQVIGDLKSIQAIFDETTNGAIALSKATGLTTKEAKALATSLGLTTKQAAAVASKIQEMNRAGLSAAQQFEQLSKETSITEKQFSALEKSIKAAEAALKQAGQGTDKVFDSDAIRKQADQVDRLNNGYQSLAIGASAIAGSLALIGKGALDTGIKFEKLQTALETALGSKSAAEAAFENIQKFAAATPFSVEQVTESFTKLKNRGLDPTNETLTRLGDIASSQAKDLNQITEAILDATSGGGFERLKEFGIQAKDAGDKVTLSFKGVSKTVADTPKAISEAILAFGDLKGVAGGMEAQSKTLGGQISNLQDNFDSLSRVFFEVAEGPAKALVGTANSLISSFLALPAPVQAVVIGVTGLTGAIAAAVAVLATYKALQVDAAIANAALAVKQAIATAATIAQTVATKAQAASQAILNLATKEYTLAQVKAALTDGIAAAKKALVTAATNAQALAQQALAIATGKADAATLAQVGNLGKLATVAVLAAGAVASISLALSRFNDGGKEFKDAAGEIEKKLLDIELQSGKTGAAIKSSIPDEPPPTDFVDGILDKVNQVARERNKLLGLDENLFILPTNAEKQLNDARLGVDQLRDATTKLGTKAREVGATFQDGITPSNGQVEQAKNVQDAFTAAIQKTEEKLTGLDPNKLGKKAYEQLKNQLEVTKAELIRSQAEFQKTTGVTGGNTAATLADAAASEENSKAKKKESDTIKELNKIRADSLKQKRDDQKIVDERGFQDNERTIDRQLADQKADREKKLQDEIAKRQEETDAKIAALQKKNQSEADRLKEESDRKLQDRQLKFEQEQADFKEAREGQILDRQREFERGLTDFKLAEEAKIAAKKKQFEKEIADFKEAEEKKIQQLQRDFEDRQKDDERRFQSEQQAKEKTFQDEINGKKDTATRQIDRTLQLEEADPAERAKLQKQFEEEDKRAKRRKELEAQILKPIQDQEEAFKAQQKAAEEAFKTRQEAEKRNFADNTLDPARSQLDQAVGDRQDQADSVISKEQQALEDALNQKKLEFEQGPLKELKDQLETDLQNRKLEFERGPLSELKKQIEIEQQAQREAGEAAIAEIKKQNEKDLQALKDSNAATEKELERQAEDQRQARERTFKDEQRQKDLENAEEVKRILESTVFPDIALDLGDKLAAEIEQLVGNAGGGVSANIPKLFTGGDVAANQPVIVGDGPGGTIGPNTELFVPRVAGRILNANQTREVMASLPQFARFTRPAIAVAPSAGVTGQSMGAMLEELKGLRQLVKQRPVVPTKVDVNHFGDPRSSRAISYNTMHDLLRMQRL